MATASRQPCSDQGVSVAVAASCSRLGWWLTVAEIGGHARIDTLWICTRPTGEDKFAALDYLTVDR
jgi:hypothetical protein